MSVIFVDGFEYYNNAENWDDKITPKRDTFHVSLLGILKENSIRVIESGTDDRGGFNLIDKDGAVEVEPVKGNPRSWVVTVYVPEDNGKDSV